MAFTVLWAVGRLLYQLRFPVEGPAQLPLFVACIVAIAFPGWRWSLFLLAAAGLGTSLWHAPLASTFLTLYAAVDLLVLVVLGLARADAKTFRSLVLLVAATTYLFAVFHKINAAYFDPVAGPVGEIVGGMKRADYPFYSAWYPALLPGSELGLRVVLWSVLAVELAIPVMLLVPRWRRAGILVDIVFHLFMAYRMVPLSTNFPSVMLAVVALYMRLPSCGWWQSLGWQRRVAVAVTGGLLLVPLGFRLGDSPESLRVLGNVLREVVYLSCVAWSLWMLCVRRVGVRRDAIFPPRSRLGWVVLAAWVLNCLAPHLGLKTTGCGEMYSGLDTLSGNSNHLIIPPSWQCFGYARDTVTVLGSDTSKYLATLGAERTQMPYIEFLRMARRKARHHCRFERGGEVVDGRLGDFDDVRDPPFSLIERKLLSMHHVSGGTSSDPEERPPAN